MPTAKRTRTVAKIVVSDELTLKVQSNGNVIETYSDNTIPGEDVLAVLAIMEELAAVSVVQYRERLPKILEATPSIVDDNGDSIRQGTRNDLRLRIGCQSFNLATVRVIAAKVRQQMNRK